MAKKVAQKKAKKTISPKRPATKSRKLSVGQYRSFRVQKSIKHPAPPVKSSLQIFRESLRLLLKNWKLFGGIMLVYIVLDILLVKIFDKPTDVSQLKTAFGLIFAGSGQFQTSLNVFQYLLGSASSAPSDVAGAYQSMLLVIISLAVIWALRQVSAKQTVRIRDAFYKGMHALIPFVLVLLVIFVQLLPIFTAKYLFDNVFGNTLAVSVLEKALWGVLIFLLSILSLYLIASSFIALYIVTLPDTPPLQALRSARELVRFRRSMVVRKLLFLPFALVLLAGIITVPLILFIPAIAEWSLFVLIMLGLAVVHAYMYSLYRELL